MRRITGRQRFFTRTQLPPSTGALLAEAGNPRVPLLVRVRLPCRSRRATSRVLPVLLALRELAAGGEPDARRRCRTPAGSSSVNAPIAPADAHQRRRGTVLKRGDGGRGPQRRHPLEIDRSPTQGAGWRCSPPRVFPSLAAGDRPPSSVSLHSHRGHRAGACRCTRDDGRVCRRCCGSGQSTVSCNCPARGQLPPAAGGTAAPAHSARSFWATS